MKNHYTQWIYPTGIGWFATRRWWSSGNHLWIPVDINREIKHNVACYFPVNVSYGNQMADTEYSTVQANLFDIVPPALFQPLAAPSRRIYVAALLRLYKLAEDAAFIGEERAVEEVLDVLVNAGQEDQAFLINEDEAIQLALQAESIGDEDEQTVIDIYRRQRIQARAILRRLVTTGWLKDETQADLSLHYTLFEYTFPILDGFWRAIERRPTEFEGLIYSTYQLLKQPDPHISGYVVLQQVFDQTRQIVTGLKQLQHNIGTYIKQITEKLSSVPDVLRNFAGYRTEVSPTYHRLKTADHLSRYRLDIQQSLQSMANSTVWLDAAIVEAQRRRPDALPAAAQTEIYQQLTYIQTQFEQMGQVISTIDDRHSRYAEAAVVQVRYGVAGGQDTVSRLIEICHTLRTIPGPGHHLAPEPLQSLFQLFEAGYINQNSLYTPRRIKQRYQSPPLNIVEISSAMKQKIQREIQQELEEVISPTRVWTYLAPYLKHHATVESAALPLDTIEDWLMLIGLQVYSDLLKDKYKILPAPAERPWVETPYFRCANFCFTRKES